MNNEEQLNRFREVVEQSLSMVVIINPDGTINYINPRVTQILGFAPEEIIGKPHVFTSTDEKGISYYQKIYDDLTTKGHFTGEIEVRKKDGSNLWVRATIAYVYKDDEPLFLVGHMEDVTLEMELKKEHRESQEMMKTIMDNVIVSITLMDYNGYFTYLNKQAELNLNLPAELLKSRPIVELFPEEGPSTLAGIRQIMKLRKPGMIEVSYNIQGKEKYFEINRLPLFDEKGEVYNVMSIARDITATKYADKWSKILHAIDSLQSIGETFEESLNILFDNLFSLGWVDAAGLYLVNHKLKLLELVFHRGLSKEFVNSESKFDLDSENALVIFKKIPIYANGEILSVLLRKNNNENLTFLAILPLVYQDRVLGVLNLASRTITNLDPFERNVTETIGLKVANLIELIRTRQDLDRSNAELQARLEELNVKQQLLIQKSRLESLGELSAGLAHEINQPISIISLAMENISYKLDQQAATREYLERKFNTITQNINKIRELIDHVRIFSRDQGTILFEQVDVNQVILNALSMIGSQLKYRDIRIKTELDKNIGYTLGNSSRLEQVIFNLLSNSRDAVEEMAGKNEYNDFQMEIRIKTAGEDGMILISVWDNGTGISSENISRIFNPFFTTKSAGNGTGLGLPIVYGIIREMKGEITVHSEERIFTEFRITLPQYKKIVSNNSKL